MKSLNIKVFLFFEMLGGTLGYYNRYKRIQFIHINNDAKEALQKFICAHELGHAILHPNANTPFLKKNTFFSIERIEIEANTFAVELLLSDDVIYEYKDNSLSINEIANMYSMPEEVSHLNNLRNVR